MECITFDTGHAIWDSDRGEGAAPKHSILYFRNTLSQDNCCEMAVFRKSLPSHCCHAVGNSDGSEVTELESIIPDAG